LGGQVILQKENMYKPPEAPSCFGTHLWSATDKECVGGPDPGYTHPQTGAHARERCKFYQDCATASAQSRAQPFVPVQSLLRQPPAPIGVQPPPRPVAPHPGLPSRPPPLQQQYQYPQQQQPQQYQPQVQQAYAAYAPPHVVQMGPLQIPMQYQQMGAQIPMYLTMPEPIYPGDSLLKILARTLFRSILKACGHSLASFVDHVPLRPHVPRLPPE